MDMGSWWLLLFPAAFGLGWLASRFDLKQLLSESANLPRTYFRGLNFLLNEQPDKAIDAFIEAVKLEPETTELHFALGSLFRRRGETERAIRVHQNLLNRPDLPTRERDHALYELGQDFLKAGLLDRAEQTLQQLDQGLYAIDAQRALLSIFEIEKDWRRAITTATALKATGSQSYAKEISHFHCELAQEALQKKQLDVARDEIESALRINSRNVRATILSGDVELASGNPDAALKSWQSVEQQNPHYLTRVAERIMKSYQASGRDAEGVELLSGYIDRYHGAGLLDVVYPYVSSLRGEEQARALARVEMQKAPTAAGMLRLLDGQLAQADEPQRSELQLMRNLVFQRTRNLPRYTCRACGFRARLFYWQCPSCTGWETYAPRRQETLASSS